MNTDQIKYLADSFRIMGVSLDMASNALHSIGSILHRNECVKWAHIIADLRADPNTNPAALKAAWKKFKII